MWTFCVIKTPRAKARPFRGRIPIMPRHFQPPGLDTIYSDEGEEFVGLDDVTGTTSNEDDIDEATAAVEIPAVGEHPTYEDYEDVSYSYLDFENSRGTNINLGFEGCTASIGEPYETCQRAGCDHCRAQGEST